MLISDNHHQQRNYAELIHVLAEETTCSNSGTNQFTDNINEFRRQEATEPRVYGATQVTNIYTLI